MAKCGGFIAVGLPAYLGLGVAEVAHCGVFIAVDHRAYLGLEGGVDEDRLVGIVGVHVHFCEYYRVLRRKQFVVRYDCQVGREWELSEEVRLQTLKPRQVDTVDAVNLSEWGIETQK